MWQQYLLPILIPIASFAITQGIKWLWEKYGTQLPTAVSVSIAGAVGAALTAVIQIPGINPIIGIILGVAAAAVHDIVTPPAGTPPPVASGIVTKPK